MCKVVLEFVIGRNGYDDEVDYVNIKVDNDVNVLFVEVVIWVYEVEKIGNFIVL